MPRKYRLLSAKDRQKHPVIQPRSTQTEAAQHRYLVNWLRLRGLKFHHSPNENPDAQARRRNAQRGTSAGFPDFLVVTPRGLVFIELKRTKGGRLAPEQVAWLDVLRPHCAAAAVCAGWIEAAELVQQQFTRSEP